MTQSVAHKDKIRGKAQNALRESFAVRRPAVKQGAHVRQTGAAGGAAPAPQPLAPPPPLHALSDAAAPEDDDARAAEALAALAAFFAPLLWAWRALGRLADGFEDTYARTTPAWVDRAPWKFCGWWGEDAGGRCN